MDTHTALCILFILHWNRLTLGAKDETCPNACFCNPLSKLVYCSRRGLTRIPSQIPDASQQLNINGNLLDSPVLQRRNFSRFVHLEHLYLSECGIERIDVGTFTDLTKLAWLDLSSNRIRVVEDYTFRGLSLSHLFLNGNRNINIKRNAFAGCVTTGLYLHECSLSKLNLDVFVHLNNTLKTLWVNDNELTKVDKRFLPMFSNLTHIRLGSNPLHCNCELLWLKEFYDKNGGKFEEAGIPSCLSPHKLKSKQFSEISLFDFQCQPPSFRNIDAVFKGNEGMLRCTASGDPSPLLYWVQPNSVSTVYKPSSNESIRYNQAVLNISTEHTRKQDLSGSYFCVALNDAGNMTLTFNLTWPSHRTDEPKFKVVPVLETSDHADNRHSTTRHSGRIESHDHVTSTSTSTTTVTSKMQYNPDSGVAVSSNDDRHKVTTKDVNESSLNTKDTQFTTNKVQTEKYYTLAELIGAILGTFFATIVLCIILIPLYFRRKWKNNNSPHHTPASKYNLQETMHLNGSGSRGPQLPPRPPGHTFNYFDSAISSMSRR